jgi:hypothetical protein
MSGLQLSSLLLAVVLAASGAYSQEIVLAENGIQGSLNWTTCGEQAIRVERLSLAGCASINCVLKMNQNYQGNFTMSPRNNHTSTIIKVEASNTVLLSTTLSTRLNATLNYIVTFPLIFDSRFAKNNSREYQLVKVTVTGTNNRTEVCRTFPVYLDSSVPGGNNQNKYGDSCRVTNSPCNFPNSMCISGTCKCGSLSVENSKECKKRVGVPCSNNSECLKNGECRSGLGVCDCKSKYKPNSTGEKCSSGTEAITFSVLLIALQQMLVFFHKW